MNVGVLLVYESMTIMFAQWMEEHCHKRLFLFWNQLKRYIFNFLCFLSRPEKKNKQKTHLARPCVNKPLKRGDWLTTPYSNHSSFRFTILRLYFSPSLPLCFILHTSFLMTSLYWHYNCNFPFKLVICAYSIYLPFPDILCLSIIFLNLPILGFLPILHRYSLYLSCYLLLSFSPPLCPQFSTPSIQSPIFCSDSHFLLIKLPPVSRIWDAPNDFSFHKIEWNVTSCLKMIPEAKLAISKLGYQFSFGRFKDLQLQQQPFTWSKIFFNFFRQLFVVVVVFLCWLQQTLPFSFPSFLTLRQGDGVHVVPF